MELLKAQTEAAIKQAEAQIEVNKSMPKTSEKTSGSKN
jgi:hypothetical protein